MTNPANDITAPDTPGALERIMSRLPPHLLARDEDAGGTLRALLTAVAGELEVLENDLQSLYDGWFVETCAEWLLPYLADLVGLAELPPDLGPGTSRRALVANTIAYRRRKGTVTVLEQVATDVTGWPARAVEFYQHLVTTTHLDHIRLDRPASASLRDSESLRLMALSHAASTTLSPGLDPMAHTAEVRGISSRRGRYGLPAIGVFLYPLRINEVGPRGWSTARHSPDGYTIDPLGRSTPLFTPPSNALDPPVPLDPHLLLSRLRDARQKQEPDLASLPVGVRIHDDHEHHDLGAHALRVAGLEGLAADIVAGGGFQAMMDVTTGTVTVCQGATPDPTDRLVQVRYAYGSSSDVGAGTYDRAVVHSQVIDSDRYNGPATTTQVAVLARTPPAPTGAIGDAVARLATAPAGTHVISIGDNARYDENLTLRVPEGTRIVLVAAAWPLGTDSGSVAGVYLPDGLRPHLHGTLTITGEPGSSVVIDGILLDGDLEVTPGELGSLTVSQSTVAGRITMGHDDTTNGDLRVRVARSILCGIQLGPVVPGLSVTDSIVDEGLIRADAANAAVPTNAPAVSGDTTHASFDGVTVRGTVVVRSLDASSCLFDGPLVIAHRQTGSLRYTYTRPSSPTPRRFNCVPAESRAAAPAPVYASTLPGAPDYLALSTACPPQIRTGGEYDAEMGVHHHLRRPLRAEAATRQLAPYLPVGREIGIFGS